MCVRCVCVCVCVCDTCSASAQGLLDLAVQMLQLSFEAQSSESGTGAEPAFPLAALSEASPELRLGQYCYR